MLEAFNTEGFFWATHARGVERCVWEQATWSEWATADGRAAATILHDLLQAFDHVAHQKLVDAAVRTRFPKVHSNSASVWAKLQLRLAPLGVTGDLPWIFLIRFRRPLDLSSSARHTAVDARFPDVKSIWSSAAATASTNCARFGVKGESLWRCSHWAQ